MIAWKYVILERHQFPGLEWAVILPPNGLPHATVAAMGRPVSAGFCEFSENCERVQAFGESVSLGLQSRPERDARVLFANFCLPLLRERGRPAIRDLGGPDPIPRPAAIRP